jgi:hypothetical protein
VRIDLTGIVDPPGGSGGVQVDVQDEEVARIVAIVAVGRPEQLVRAVRAVDEPLALERWSRVRSGRVGRQPDVAGHEMEGRPHQAVAG